MATAIFIVLSVISIGAVLGMMITKNRAYSALFLVLSFSSLGGLFGLLKAPFVAVAQIIVYAGAIMVMFLFASLTVGEKKEISGSARRRIKIFSVILSVILFLEIAAVVFRIVNKISPFDFQVSARDMGALIINRYLYAFELTSVLIVVAVVAALALSLEQKS